MTQREFLEGLRSALGNDLKGPVIQENVDYYNGYISDEIKKGRMEEEVTAELGDPWIIARTIIDSNGGRSDAGYQDNYYEPRESGYGRGQEKTERNHVSRAGTWWKRLLLVLAIAGIIMAVFTVVGGILSLIAPFVVPVLVIAIILRLFNSRR